MSPVMRAVVASRPGPMAEVLEVRELPESGALGDDEVVVRMIASTVNPSDAVSISGAYASRTSFPFVGGFEGVGVIERGGRDVPTSAIGRRVLPIGSAGGWAEAKKTGLSWCVPVPDDLDDETACFAYINPLTASLMIERFCGAGVREVAVTAATTTIADHLAELLNLRGITPIALTRGTPGSSVARPERWGAVISTAGPDWRDRLREVSAGRLDLVLDCVGGPLGLPLLRELAPGGVFVHFGLLSGVPLPAACFAGERGTRVEMFRLRDTVHTVPRTDLPTLFRPVFDHLRADRLLSRHGREVPLRALPSAVGQGWTGAAGKLLVHCAG